MYFTRTMIRYKKPLSFLQARKYPLLQKIIIFLLGMVLSLAFPTHGDETEGWRKAESDDQYPELYSEDFIDSLFCSKDAFTARKWRTNGTTPVCKGEKLVYTMGWGPLHAGYAILTATPDTVDSTLIIMGKGATNAFFSAFYKVRDCYRTIIDQEGMYPLFFEQHIREGKFRTNRWDLFDQVRHRVYTDKHKPEFFKSKPFTQSLMSLVYYLRTMSFAPGDSFTIDCFVDTMCHRVKMKCMKRKTIKVDVGAFDCLLVKPYLIGKGRVFSKKDEIRVWFTNDEYKMPVVIESKIRWGTLYAKLIWYGRKR